MPVLSCSGWIPGRWVSQLKHPGSKFWPRSKKIYIISNWCIYLKKKCLEIDIFKNYSVLLCFISHKPAGNRTPSCVAGEMWQEYWNLSMTLLAFLLVWVPDTWRLLEHPLLFYRCMFQWTLQAPPTHSVLITEVVLAPRKNTSLNILSYNIIWEASNYKNIFDIPFIMIWKFRKKKKL